MWSGQSGTFTRNASANAPKRSASAPGASPQAFAAAARVQSITEYVWMPVAFACAPDVKRIATNMRSEPTNVKRKNFIAA